MDRRRFLKSSAAIASTTLVAQSARAASNELVVCSWGGAFQDAQREAIFKPFESATGIKIVEASGPSMAKLAAMVQSGNIEWDVVNITPGDFRVLANRKLLEPFDYSRWNKSLLNDVDQRVIDPYGIGNNFYTKVIAFNTKTYTRDTGPKNWADVWDVKKFPGPRILDAGNFAVPPIEYVLLADGVPADKLYPLDLDRAYRALTRIKPSVVKWATSSAMAPQGLNSGEAVIAAATMGRVAALKNGGAPVDFTWNQGLLQFDYWCVPKGTKNTTNAMKFIEFSLQPEGFAALCKSQPVGPVNRRAFDVMSPDLAKTLPSYPPNLEQQILLNPAWWAETDSNGKSNIEKNSQRWNEWVLR
jgi:putative spermidine/putrescine transport system substrate-binding protein